MYQRDDTKVVILDELLQNETWDLESLITTNTYILQSNPEALWSRWMCHIDDRSRYSLKALHVIEVLPHTMSIWGFCTTQKKLKSALGSPEVLLCAAASSSYLNVKCKCLAIKFTFCRPLIVKSFIYLPKMSHHSWWFIMINVSEMGGSQSETPETFLI